MKVASYLLGLLLLAGVSGPAAAESGGFATYGHPALEAIDSDYLAGRISEAEALLYRFYFIKAWDKLPAEYQLRSDTPIRCGTSILAEVYDRLNELPAAMLDEIVIYRERYDWLPNTRNTTHFRLHYTLVGTDAVPNEAYVDAVEQACEASWTELHVAMTWDVPPGDGGLGGGTNLIDCYIHNAPDGILGYAEYENSVPGDPPYDFTGYFHVDNNIGFASTLRNTVAHEYMHVVQFGYYATGAGSVSWYWENCAMMAEEWVYDSDNEYEGYLQAFFGFPYKSLKYTNGQYEYGGIVWPMYKVERFGDEDLVERVYDCIQWVGALGIWDCFDDELAPFGSDMNAAYSEFMRWNYYTRDRDDGQHYEEGGDWGAFLWPDNTFRTYPTGDQHPRTAMRPEPLGTSIMSFEPQTGSTDGVLHVDFNGPDLVTMACDFIRKQDGADVWFEYYMTLDPSTGVGSIDIPGFNNTDHVFMFTSIKLATGAGRDYVFSADDLPGSGDITDDLNVGNLVRIYPFRPNPLVAVGSVAYALAEGGSVEVQILDASGRAVRNLFSGELHAGNYEVMWHGVDDAGVRVPAGVYYARILANGQEATRPVTLLR